MLRDAGVRHLLTEGRLLGELPEHEAEVLCVDRDAAMISRHETGDLPSELSSDHLAYVVYTSGATGAPKGVMLTHRSLCSRLLWGARTFGVDGPECYLQSASWAYDASVWALLEPWIAGGRCVIARSDSRSDGRYLVRAHAGREGDLHRGLAHDAGRPTRRGRNRELRGAPARVRMGRAARRPRWPTVSSRARRRSSTTCTGRPRRASASRTGGAGLGHRRARSPSGARTPTREVYILDPARRPVPVGVPGELYVGGAGVARGYLNRPELTAERFVPSPFRDAGAATRRAEARLFRTGDLARFMPDGTIECLGRIDRQVKIRGNRVELGEVEAVLGRHPGVRDCAVVARSGEVRTAGGRAEPRLVAYFVSEAPVPPGELRRLCRGALPGFMVPTTFIRLAALPHTSSGKIDERAASAARAGGARAPGRPRPAAGSGRGDRRPDLGGRPGDGVGQRRRELLRRWRRFAPRSPADDAGGGGIRAGRDGALAHRGAHGRRDRGAGAGSARCPRSAGLDATSVAGSSLVAIRREGSKRPFFLVAGGAGGERELLVYANLAPHLDADQPFFGVPMLRPGRPWRRRHGRGAGWPAPAGR